MATSGNASYLHFRPFDHVNVIYEPGESGPEAFFLRVGFEPVGETQYGETIGIRKL